MDSKNSILSPFDRIEDIANFRAIVEKINDNIRIQKIFISHPILAGVATESPGGLHDEAKNHAIGLN